MKRRLVFAWAVCAACAACGAPDPAGNADAAASRDDRPDARAETQTATAVDTGPSATDPYPLAFVTLLTGKVAVFRRSTMTLEAVVGTGHAHTIGVAVMPGQQTIWYPNGDAKSLDRYERVAGDASKWKLVRQVKAPEGFQFLDTSADGRIVGLDDFNTHGGGNSPSPNVMLFDTASETFLPVVSMGDPSILALTSTGKTLYVADNKPGDGAVAVVDVQQAEVKQRWPLIAGEKYGGLGHLDLSPDDKTLAVALFMQKTVVLIDVTSAKPAPRNVKLPMMVFWVAFSPDSKSVYAVTVADLSKEGDEVKNAKIPTTLSRIDVATGQVLASAQWTYAFAHIGMPLFGNTIYASAAYGNVLAFDATTLNLTGQLVVQPGLATPAMSISF